ncbi:unnamed protein product, partial [Ectocarpus sp. 13 AM-2016]
MRAGGCSVPSITDDFIQGVLCDAYLMGQFACKLRVVCNRAIPFPVGFIVHVPSCNLGGSRGRSDAQPSSSSTLLAYFAHSIPPDVIQGMCAYSKQQHRPAFLFVHRFYGHPTCMLPPSVAVVLPSRSRRLCRIEQTACTAGGEAPRTSRVSRVSRPSATRPSPPTRP